MVAMTAQTGYQSDYRRFSVLRGILVVRGTHREIRYAYIYCKSHALSYSFEHVKMGTISARAEHVQHTQENRCVWS